MRVYLVAKQGGRTAFKITTASVFSNLDLMFKERLTELTKETHQIDTMLSARLRKRPKVLNIYYAELNSLGNARKVTEEMWKELASTWIYANKEAVREAAIERKRLAKEK